MIAMKDRLRRCNIFNWLPQKKKPQIMNRKIFKNKTLENFPGIKDLNLHIKISEWLALKHILVK